MSETAELTASGAIPHRVSSFAVSHLSADDFQLDGLRSYARYRNFGFAEMTNGAFQGHVLRFVPGYMAAVAGKRHYHDVNFQMVYLFAGMISYEFEGYGEITMVPGDCWIQPAGVRHTVLTYSDDCELLEVVMPAEYDTGDVAPAGQAPDAANPIRHSMKNHPPPQDFVASKDHSFHPHGLRPYALYRDFGFARGTGGLVQAHLLKFRGPYDPAVAGLRHVHDCSFQFDYLLKGSITMEFDGVGPVTMRPGSAWIQPGGVAHSVLDYSPDCELLEMITPAEYDTVNVPTGRDHS
jgi:quercetin dioxygenase-like cupin family protein